MYQNKTVLLIGGGGTVGTYIARELLRLGCRVDVICLEDYKSQNEKLRYLRWYSRSKTSYGRDDGMR